MQKPDLVVTLNVDCGNVDTKLRIENVFGIGRLSMDKKWCNSGVCSLVCCHQGGCWACSVIKTALKSSVFF